MLRLGTYDDEVKTFEVMQHYCTEHQLNRRTLNHREIYISDPRKVRSEKIKTVLRYFVE